MADLTITAASVLAGAGARVRHLVAGATITAGQVVYVGAGDVALLADNNSATAAARVPAGIALNGGATGQPVAVAVVESDVTIGATMTAGVAYYLSDTPGGICPVADVGSGEYPAVVGMAISTTVLRLVMTSAGVAL